MKKLYFIPLALTFFFLPIAQADFPDVPTSSEYHQAVSTLEDLGIVQGYPDGTFKLDQPVNRAELLKMVYSAENLHHDDRRWWAAPELFPFGQEDTIKINPPCFTDFAGTEWFEPYACWGKEQGLVEGYEGGYFAPLKTVNFAEAAKILVETSGEPGVRTGSMVEHWAEGYIETISMGMVPPSIQAADQQLTRADAAQLIFNYTLVEDKILEDLPSNALIWDGQKYLTFECLGAYDGIHFLRREGKIYWRDTQNLKVTYLLEGSDAATFEVLENGLSKDKKQYYHQTEAIEFEGDIENLEFLSHNLAKEGDKVHYFDPEGGVEILDYVGAIDHYISAAIDTPATLVGSEHYLTDGTLVYYLNTDQMSPPLKVVEDADPGSFELAPLEDGGPAFIAFDDNALYWEGEKIEESAGGSFEALDTELDVILKYHQVPYRYAQDDQYIYLLNCYFSCSFLSVFPNSDAPTFEILEDGYAKDKNQIYYLQEVLEGEVSQNFETLGNGYAAGEHVYYQGKIILTADPDTFELSLANHEELYCTMPFAKDDDHLFLQDKQLYNVDAESFEFLDPYGFFFRDADSVYRVILEAKGDPCRSPEWVVLSGIDGDSFDFLSPYYFKSNGQVYHTTATGITNVINEADYDTFEPLVTDLIDDSDVRYSYYAKDAVNAYYNTKIISEIDVETFEYDAELRQLKDENGVYGWSEISKRLGL